VKEQGRRTTRREEGNSFSKERHQQFIIYKPDIMKEDNFKITIFKSNLGKTEFPEYLMDSGETVISPQPNDSFTVEVSVHNQIDACSTFYIAALTIDGKPLNYWKKIQCFPDMTKSSIEFPGFKTPEGTFAFEFADLATTSNANSSNFESDNQLGTIAVEFYEAFPTNEAQALLFTNSKKEPEAPQKPSKVLTSEKPAEAKSESIPSVPEVVVKEKPKPAKPTIFEDTTQDNKKFWKTPALLTIPGKKLFGPYVPPPKEKTEEPKTTSEKTTNPTQSALAGQNVGKDNDSNHKISVEKEVSLPTAPKPVENENKLNFHWNQGKLLKKLTIRYQVKKFLKYSVPEIQEEFDKKRKWEEENNQKKNNQTKKGKKSNHSSEDVKSEKTKSSATLLKGIPRCDLTMEEGKPKWDELPIVKPEELK
jgi:hypothetical protein